MTDIITVKANVVDGVTRVKLVASHAMGSGQNTGETENAPDTRFLQEITVLHEDKTVFAANLSTAISKDPFLGFAFSGGSSGDELIIHWVENTGETGTEKAVIK